MPKNLKNDFPDSNKNKKNSTKSIGIGTQKFMENKFYP